MESLLSAIRAKAWPIFLHGPAGTGKTCAALCLLDLVQAGDFLTYLTVSELAERLIDCQQERLEFPGFHADMISPATFWDLIAARRLFVLDELGVRDKVSEFAYEATKRAIDARHGKPFVAISNIGLDDIAKVYDARVMSRLAAGTVIEISGDDRRLFADNAARSSFTLAAALDRLRAVEAAEQKGR